MGPIEYTLCQVAHKIQKKYNDFEFSSQVYKISSLLHESGIEDELLVKGWDDDENLTNIQLLGRIIQKELDSKDKFNNDWKLWE